MAPLELHRGALRRLRQRGQLLGHYFINSTAGLNDNASSIANYDSGYSLRTYYHSNYTYPYISVLPYGQASGGTSYAYYSLGSFNDELSSHLWF
ncbi:hypothetical protein [Phytohabitans rumicis]|uniref:Uncharacterized protein n=1 Tax=Phytohabitans rumicis TaxID=1076125 RepID=A0A6V8L9H0_9ACTN|nr:hypothetical protein [Phytohabitans rumicis]GFJ91209.1 hypothetical protein Prum_048510 [Phytohabitans rumicis]